MGNCLRSRRRHELLLHSCDGDDGKEIIYSPVVFPQLRLIMPAGFHVCPL
jgi:hypothetical protein